MKKFIRIPPFSMSSGIPPNIELIFCDMVLVLKCSVLLQTNGWKSFSKWNFQISESNNAFLVITCKIWQYTWCSFMLCCWSRDLKLLFFCASKCSSSTVYKAYTVQGLAVWAEVMRNLFFLVTKLIYYLVLIIPLCNMFFI